jgi:hypothetical protein
MSYPNPAPLPAIPSVADILDAVSESAARQIQEAVATGDLYAVIVAVGAALRHDVTPYSEAVVANLLAGAPDPLELAVANFAEHLDGEDAMRLFFAHAADPRDLDDAFAVLCYCVPEAIVARLNRTML